MIKVEDFEIESVECIGTFDDEYVYDIEMSDDPHVFFANDILVHNSAYVNAEPFLKNKFGDDIKWTKAAVQKYCDYLDEDIVPLINDNCAKIVKDVFWSEVSTIEFKRETMCSHGAFVAKKRYCLLVRNDEGTPVKKWKYVGLDVKKNEYTKETKESISKTIETMILEKWDNSAFSDHVYNLWEEFQTRAPEQIGVIKGYNTYKKYFGGFRSEPGTLAHVRAVHYHNDIIKQKDLGLPELRFKEKLQYVWLKPNENEFHIDIIGFDFEWPDAFNDLFDIDYRELFNRTIIKPLTPFIDLQHYTVPNVEQKDVFNINEL